MKYQESIDASLKAIKIIEVLCQGDIKAIRQNRLCYTACNTLAAIYGVIPNEVEKKNNKVISLPKLKALLVKQE